MGKEKSYCGNCEWFQQTSYADQDDECNAPENIVRYDTYKNQYMAKIGKPKFMNACNSCKLYREG